MAAKRPFVKIKKTTARHGKVFGYLTATVANTTLAVVSPAAVPELLAVETLGGAHAASSRTLRLRFAF